MDFLVQLLLCILIRGSYQFICPSSLLISQGQNASITQTTLNCTYLYIVSDTTQYIFFEIKIDSIQNDPSYPLQYPVLVARKNIPVEKIQTSTNTYKLILDHHDMNAYWQNKKYHFIQIPINELQLNDIWYISFLAQPTTQIQYSLTLTLSNNPECPQDCKPFGNCVSTINQAYCDCPLNYIDVDCTIKADMIYKDLTIQKVISSINPVYVYFKMPIGAEYAGSDLEFVFTKPNGKVYMIYLQIEGFGQAQVEIPNKFNYYQKDSVMQNQYVVSVPRDFFFNDLGKARKIIFSLTSLDQDFPIQIEVRSPDSGSSAFDGNMMIVYFLLGVAGVLFLVWIVLTIIRIRYQRNNNIMPQSNSRVRPQARGLTVDILNKFMPVRLYSQYSQQQKKKENVEDNCAVCLVEFTSQDEVRITICNHCFHRECLETWLKKMENCPLCRFSMSISDLKKIDIHQLQNQNGNQVNNQSQNNQANQENGIQNQVNQGQNMPQQQSEQQDDQEQDNQNNSSQQQQQQNSQNHGQAQHFQNQLNQQQQSDNQDENSHLTEEDNVQQQQQQQRPQNIQQQPQTNLQINLSRQQSANGMARRSLQPVTPDRFFQEVEHFEERKQNH